MQCRAGVHHVPTYIFINVVDDQGRLFGKKVPRHNPLTTLEKRRKNEGVERFHKIAIEIEIEIEHWRIKN